MEKSLMGSLKWLHLKLSIIRIHYLETVLILSQNEAYKQGYLTHIRIIKAHDVIINNYETKALLT